MQAPLAYLSMNYADLFYLFLFIFCIARKLYYFPVSFSALLNINLLFVPRSGENCGIGPSIIWGSGREQWPSDFWSSWAEDEEGNVPDCWTTVQRVTDQTDGHTAQHQPQLPALHHPQP